MSSFDTKMSIEEYMSGAVSLHLIVEHLLIKVNERVKDSAKFRTITQAIENSNTPQESIQLLGAILVYGYDYMSEVILSFAYDEHESVRLALRKQIIQ